MINLLLKFSMLQSGAKFEVHKVNFKAKNNAYFQHL